MMCLMPAYIGTFADAQLWSVELARSHRRDALDVHAIAIAFAVAVASA